MTLTFTVYGVPKEKGNMRAINIKGMKFPIVTDSNKSTKSWQQLIAQGASDAIQELPASERGVIDGAVRLTTAFYMPRPKKFNKRGVPVACLTSPDWDKLARSVSDALEGVCYANDKQITEAVIGKFYAGVDDAPHVDVRIEPTAGLKLSAYPAAPLPLFEAIR